MWRKKLTGDDDFGAAAVDLAEGGPGDALAAVAVGAEVLFDVVAADVGLDFQLAHARHRIDELVLRVLLLPHRLAVARKVQLQRVRRPATLHQQQQQQQQQHQCRAKKTKSPTTISAFFVVDSSLFRFQSTKTNVPPPRGLGVLLNSIRVHTFQRQGGDTKQHPMPVPGKTQ